MHTCHADMSVHERGNIIQHPERGRKTRLARRSIAGVSVWDVWDVKLVVAATE